jgi:peptidoglycan-associated lipoprotein
MLALAAILFLDACKKKTAAPPPPPPPPPSAEGPSVPTASLTADPATIQRGQSTTLTWQTSNATTASIDGIGSVPSSGSQGVSPTESTTYHLVAKGAAGTQEATARVTVTQPPAPPPIVTPNEGGDFESNVKDIYFDYDKYDVRADQQATIQADAKWLSAHPEVKLTVEGHCDERGSTEYNLALGDNRANAAKQALVQAGVSGERIKTISFGKEKPFCTEATEECYQQNRRGHFVYGQ